MYPRLIFSAICEALSDTPVLLINGPRQAGKSTLAELVGANYDISTYVSLDDPTQLSLAKKDPTGFVNQTKGLMIIDEVQRAPHLLLAIKHSVDRDRRPGRFLLTGSANILLMPNISDSLAGRIEIISLPPLANEEINAEPLNLIENLFNTTFTEMTLSPPTREELALLIAKGGYPEIQQRQSYSRRRSWFQSYTTTLLQKDFRELANIDATSTIPHLLKLLATRSASLLNYDELSRTSRIATTTLRRYMTFLETLFLIYRLPAWSNNYGKRIVKSPKLHFNDSGLLTNLLGLTEKGILRDNWGQLVESYVVSELIRCATYSPIHVTPYHFRTKSWEVDLVLEGPENRIVGIEVKGGATLSADDFRGLKHLAEQSGDKFLRGVVLYLGDQIVRFGENLYALPIPFH